MSIRDVNEHVFRYQSREIALDSNLFASSVYLAGEAKVNFELMRFTNAVQVEKFLVNLVVALRHFLYVVHVVSLPVAELVVGARLFQVA